MVLDKTGGLFRLAVKLMLACRDGTEASLGVAGGETGGETVAAGAATADATSAATATTASAATARATPPAKDVLALANELGLYFQIRDDYINLASEEYMKGKDFCEDLTEGKFSHPIIFGIHANPEDHRLMGILKQRTEDVSIKRYAVRYLRECGALDHTRKRLGDLYKSIKAKIAGLGGNPMLEKLCSRLHDQAAKPADISDGSRADSPRFTGARGADGLADATTTAEGANDELGSGAEGAGQIELGQRLESL